MGPSALDEKRASYTPARSRAKRTIFLAVSAAILLVIIIIIAVYFTVIKPKNNKSASSALGDTTGSTTGDGKGAGAPGSPVAAIAVTGGDGSIVMLEDGTNFTYSNSFGGTWYWDSNDPFNNGARAQSWSPALNETFKYGIDKIRGVNLGGWLVSPAVFERYSTGTPKAIDEWTLHTRMTADSANGGLTQLENHYKTFITEKDFAEIAGAGLNFVRIPLPYWAIEVRGNEPFLPKTAWTYFLKAIQWARKYGLRINLDLHALPGSQNGWNHSGKTGTINVLSGPMGLANAQRSLDYIRILAEFISQPQYRDVVTIFGIMNEPQAKNMGGQDALSAFYTEAYQIIRKASSTGQGNGPYMSIHHGFLSLDAWAGFLPNADRVTIEDHPYLCFHDQTDAPVSTFAKTPCDSWGAEFNTSMGAFGLTTAGEFSNAITDCGLWLTGVDVGTRYEGTYTLEKFPRIGSCDPVIDWPNFDAATKKAMKNVALASMDALQNWFFWTWKIGNSSVTGKVEAPHWSYKLGLDEGWMPQDPRDAIGTCGNSNPWTPPLASWQTGGSGAGKVAPGVLAAHPWPPSSINNAGDADSVPTYTATGAIPTLPGPTFTAAAGATATASVDVGNGWQNPADTDGLMVEVAGCNYLDPWIGPDAAPPSPLCS
ncbi:glycoside hydrolase family 5 protein [Mycena floridula]|nr:glycoside hydrolase family 5 protein [Mycena floridula]